MKSPNPQVINLVQAKRILIIGNGGRENALAWAVHRSKGVEEVWVAPGNGGTKSLLGCKQMDITEDNVQELIKICDSKKIDLVVIGAEGPLAAGLTDKLHKAGIAVFGPTAKGAQIEASKDWAKGLMSKPKKLSIHHQFHW